MIDQAPKARLCRVTSAMYEGFYGLSGNPFRLTPDVRFCLFHRDFRKGKLLLAQGLKSGDGGVMITGHAGTGKTTLVNDLIATTDLATARLIHISCSQMENIELLRTLASAIGMETTTLDSPRLLRRIVRALDLDHRAGRRPVLLIDEAQALGDSALQALRFLTNLEKEGKPLLQVFLVGQEKLAEILSKPTLEPLRRRLTAAFQLRPLSTNGVRAYIEHRLTCADWSGSPSLAPELFPAIRRLSDGIPRRVNHIASRLLIFGFSKRRRHLNLAHLIPVLGDLIEEGLLPFSDEKAEQVLADFIAQRRRQRNSTRYFHSDKGERLSSSQSSGTPRKPKERTLRASSRNMATKVSRPAAANPTTRSEEPASESRFDS